MKEKFFAHLETWRPYTVCWCGLVSLAGACIALGKFPPFKIAILATFIPIIGWIAGLYGMDYFDRELDKIQKSHRPIPSGRIKPKEAIGCSLFLAIGGLIGSIFLGMKNVVIAFIIAATVIAYTKVSKSKGFIGNLNRGFVIWLTFLYGCFAVDVPIPTHAWLLSAIFPIHDTNSNLIGAIRDIEGDMAGGYKTIPVKYGAKKSTYISLFLSIAWMSLALAIPIYFDFLNFPYYALLICAFSIIIIMYIHLFSSLKNLTREKALTAHEFFVIERIMLACAFIAGIASLKTSIPIFIIAITITLLSQYFLRERYEFESVMSG
jgi:4-hydroxybenzoate polyprenyltransferase/geranylgeranylglycerol-phosphate geranylgeranyltransferase